MSEGLRVPSEAVLVCNRKGCDQRVQNSLPGWCHAGHWNNAVCPFCRREIVPGRYGARAPFTTDRGTEQQWVHDDCLERAWSEHHEVVSG